MYYLSIFFPISLLSTPRTVPFHKKVVPEKDCCNRTPEKGAKQPFKFKIRQLLEFEEFLKNGKPYRNFVQIILKEH